MTDTHYLTKSGYKNLETELEALKERQKLVTLRIEEAIKMGDLSENAEYSDAKEEQGFVAGRMAEITAILKFSEIIAESSGKKTTVAIGCTVEVSYNGGKKIFTIVGSEESSPADGLISHESPLGKAFINHKKGDTVDVETPSGITSFKIVSIK